MPAIIAYPSMVRALVAPFGDLFPNAPAREHFADYLTGLFLAARKTVRGINRACAVTTDQSCRNRCRTEAPWDPQVRNARRLAWLQHDVTTRSRQDGVLASDHPVIDHEGQLIADGGSFWDHAAKRHLMAHDYLIINDVPVAGTRFPRTVQRVRTRAGAGAQCTTHTHLWCDRIDGAGARQIPGDVTVASSGTNAAIMDPIHAPDRADGGERKANRIVSVDGRAWTRSAWVARARGPRARTPITVGDPTQWSFTKTMRLPNVGHPVRIVVRWKEQRAAPPRPILVTNRVRWEPQRELTT